MSHTHAIRMLLNHLKMFLKMLCRYLAFPLRLVHLCRALVRLYSRSVSSTRLEQFQRIHTDGRPERIAVSSQPPILPLCNSQPQVPSLPGPTSNPCVSLLPPTSANHGPQAPVLSQSQSGFRPFTPAQVMRYNKIPAIKREVKLMNIPPIKRDYSDPQDSGNWSSRVHPEGALYFHDAVRGIYTDSSMRDGRRRVGTDVCINKLLALMPCGLQLRSGDIELVVELIRGEDERSLVCRYYFVDHPNRLLFWLHEISTEELFDGVQGVEKWSHIKYAIEHQYWQHCELYPSDKLLGTQLLKELKALVLHASAETITTDSSLSPFNSDELSKILDLIDRFGDVQGAHSICVIARFMRYFSRLDAVQPLFVEEKKTMFIVAFSWAIDVALFGTSQSHVEGLRQLWVGPVGSYINPHRWKNFSTVDISFLAVPSVNVQDSRSVPVATTYISVFCIVGSLVASLFMLTNQNPLYGKQISTVTAAEVLVHKTESTFGVQGLATVHALPYAMLLWGMVYFMLAFSYQVFMSTSIIALATTGSTCGIVALFMLLLLTAARDFYLLKWLLAGLGACIQVGRRVTRCLMRS
ncbi:hypothetical protein EDB19DRAFT_1122884 [Suillus lakei]|nr:hypothetical protein EDB19DRAFT_1122884 [Suillus lakei]